MSKDPYAVRDPKTGINKMSVKPQNSEEEELKQHNIAPAWTPPQLSPETLAGLEAFADAVDEAKQKDQVEEPEAPSAPPMDEDGRVDLGELPADFRSVVYQNTPWDNAQVRKKIESRTDPIRFEDLILLGRVRQEVPIVPDRLSVTFQSLTADDSLWITTESGKFADPYEAAVWSGYAKLTASIVSLTVGGKQKHYRTHLNDKGRIDPEAFELKHQEVMSIAERVLSILMTNLMWFEDRISRLFVNDFDLLKNG